MPNPEPLNPELHRTLDELAANAQRTGRAPSLVLAAGRYGERRYFRGIGAAPEDQYRIGSITKTFTAALIMQLRDAGELALEDPLADHLPEVAIGPVTLRQLLSHSAGLHAEPDGPWWERSPGVSVTELLAGVTEAKRPLPPGRFRHYSNLGFGLLGAIVERRTGASWADRLRTHLLEPAGLADVTYHPREPYARGHLVHPWDEVTRPEPTPDTRAMAPAGQLWSTAEDLLRWAEVLAGRVPAVLAPDTAAQMRSVVAMVDPGWTLGTGLGIQLDRRGERVFAGHSGSMPGFLANLAFDAESGWSTVAFANCYTGPRLSQLSHAALTHLVEQPAETPAWSPAPVPPLPPSVVGLTGRWWWMGYEVTVRFDGRLIVQDGEDEDAFEPAGTDTWRGRDGQLRGELLRVERDPDGTPLGLNIATAVYLRDPWPAEPR
ncbi:MAG TPA: serine hydrolase domain-containing protein [Mycobacteriales bacterium]|nr:serine hydrolase domain-containing protein [Mycobacteriales bacterium]